MIKPDPRHFTSCLILRFPKNWRKNGSSPKKFERGSWYSRTSVTFIPTIAGLTASTVVVMAFFLDFVTSSLELFCCCDEVKRELTCDEPTVVASGAGFLGASEYPRIAPAQTHMKINKAAFRDILGVFF